MTKPEIFPDDLIGKLVTTTFHNPESTGLNWIDFLKLGRLVKIHEDRDRVLILNPECETIEDMVGENTFRIKERFKWATWVMLADAKIELSLTDDEYLALENAAVEKIKNHWRGR